MQLCISYYKLCCKQQDLKLLLNYNKHFIMFIILKLYKTVIDYLKLSCDCSGFSACHYQLFCLLYSNSTSKMMQINIDKQYEIFNQNQGRGSEEQLIKLCGHARKRQNDKKYRARTGGNGKDKIYVFSIRIG